MTFSGGDEPLSREFSLEAFLSDLGILKYMIIGGGMGKYGMNWGHTDPGQLDSAAMEDSFRPAPNNGHKLERTTHGPDYDGWNFGEITSPSATNDGLVFTFSHAKYESSTGTFRIKTVVTKPDTTTVESTFTLTELRKMLGIPLE